MKKETVSQLLEKAIEETRLTQSEKIDWDAVAVNLADKLLKAIEEVNNILRIGKN